MFSQCQASFDGGWLGTDQKSLGVFELQEEPSVKIRKTSQRLGRAVSQPGRQMAVRGPSSPSLSHFLGLDQIGKLKS